MNLILHHALKDLRALRGPIALWLAVLVNDAAFQALKLDRFFVSPERPTDAYPALLVTGVCLLAFGWVLAAMVIQTDALDSPSAFWLTRPLSWRGLLASKLLVILSLFLVLPVAAASGVAAANGARGAVLAQFSLERLIVAASLLMPMLVAASAAHNLPRMVLVASGFVGIYATAHYGMMSLPWLWVQRTGAARVSGLLLAVVCSVAGGLALLVHRYKTRATGRTCWLAGGLVLVAVLAGDGWPWAVVGNLAAPRLDTTLLDPNAVRLSVDSDTLKRGRDTSGSVTRVSASGRPYAVPIQARVDVRGAVRAEGVPPGWIVRVTGGSGELRIAGQALKLDDLMGFHVPDWPFSENGLDPPADDVKRAIEALLHARVVNSATVGDGIRVRLFALPAGYYWDHRADRASFRGRVVVEARRISVSEPTALRPGGSCQVAGEQATVLDVAPSSRLAPLRVRDVRTSVAMRPRPSTHLVLRNRRTGEALFPVADQEPTSGFGMLTGDMTVSYLTVRIPQATSGNIDERWLADAELLIVAIETKGTFEKPLALDDFALPYSYYER
jgi:hypothetical protein